MLSKYINKSMNVMYIFMWINMSMYIEGKKKIINIQKSRVKHEILKRAHF